MDYIKQLQQAKRRRAEIVAFLAKGKTQEQASIRFGVSRQRIQQIASDEARRMSHLQKGES